MSNLVFMAIPVICTVVPLACVFGYLKREEIKDRRSPLVDDVLRLPGTSLALELRDKGFDLLGFYFVSVGVPAMAMLMLLQSWIDPEKVRLNFLAVVAILMICFSVIWSGWKTWRCIQQIAALRRGIEGEQATAQLLSPLLAQGWTMLHDLPFKRGNIDHVLVGPTGVYAVETKYRSKRSSLKGKDGVIAEYDGEAIRFAGGAVEKLPVQQAQAVASELSKFLRGRVGEEVPVVPVVALPGWYVKTTQRPSAGGAYVINPKNTALFTKRNAQLDETMRTRVVTALAELAVAPTNAK